MLNLSEILWLIVHKIFSCSFKILIQKQETLMFTNWEFVSFTLYWELYPVNREGSVSGSESKRIFLPSSVLAKDHPQKSKFPSSHILYRHSVGRAPRSHKQWSSAAIYKSATFHSPVAQYCHFYFYFFCQPAWKLPRVIEAVGGKYESDFSPLLEK